MSWTGRGRLLAAPIILVILAVLVAGAYLTGFRVNLRTGRVPVPDATAAPAAIVLAYMEAFNQRDRSAMRQLFPARGPLSRWRAVGHYSDITITMDRPMTDSERCCGGVGGSHAEAQLVGVELTYTGFDDSELSYTPGHNGWNYYLVRDSPTERWVIADQGVL